MNATSCFPASQLTTCTAATRGKSSITAVSELTSSGPARAAPSLGLGQFQGLAYSSRLCFRLPRGSLLRAGPQKARWQAVRPQAAKSKASQRQKSKTLKGNEIPPNETTPVSSSVVPVVPEALAQAPSLVESQVLSAEANKAASNRSSNGGFNGNGSSPLPQQNSPSRANLLSSPSPSIFVIWWKRAVRQLASFPLAIGMLFGIAALASVGTIIEQGESLQTYMEYYPEENPLFGFLTWRVVVGLSLDHLYTAPYFLGLLALLALSLVACTATRQWPMVRVAQRWSFLKKPEPILKLESGDTLANARVGDLATLLAANGFEVFVKGPSLYAFKGLLGRIAPIGVHAALLLVMGGGLYSAIGGYRGSSMTPQGLDFFVGDALAPNGILSAPSESMNLRVRVNRFFIEYRPDGQVKQFFSDLSMVDLADRELCQKVISVNNPLRWGGVTLYQTDWAISSIQLRVDGSNPLSLPMASLQEPGSSQKLYGTFLPLKEEGGGKLRGISILAQDLQNVVVYDAQGQFVGVRRPDSGRPITVEGMELVVEDLVGSTGLQVKMDPSVPYVYTGFGALMLTSAVSYLSHSQVWALQEGSTLYVGGKSNRAKLGFKADLDALLDLVPEVVADEEEGSSPGPGRRRGDTDDAYAT